MRDLTESEIEVVVGGDPVIIDFQPVSADPVIIDF
jgi:hypothetical protein